jgi:hypothetical protein
MKMLSVDRISSLRPIGTEVGSLGSGKGLAPVPTVSAPARIKEAGVAEPTPSLINQIGQSHKVSTAGIVYSNTADPAQRLAGAEQAPYDWRLKPPAPEKVDDKPPLPEMLIEHLKSLWIASSLAVQTPQPKVEQSVSAADSASKTNLDVSPRPGLSIL